MPKYRLSHVIFQFGLGRVLDTLLPGLGGRTEDLHAQPSAAGDCNRITVWLSYGSCVPSLKPCAFLARAGREENRRIF